MVAPILNITPPVLDPAADTALRAMGACQYALDLLGAQCAPDGTAARVAAGRVVRAFTVGDWLTAESAAGEMLGHLHDALARQWADVPATEK